MVDKNRKLIGIAEKTLKKGDGNLDLDNLSLDSDELITTQEEMIQGNEDMDGIEISDNDEVFNKNTQNEDFFSAMISSDHMKKILKHAR